MTLDKQHGRLLMLCNACDEMFEAPADVDACPAFFDAFIESAKAEGWTFRRGKEQGLNEWEHYCPDCGGGSMKL